MAIRLAQIFPDEIPLAPLLSKVERVADLFKTVPDVYGCYRALKSVVFLHVRLSSLWS